MMKKLYNVVWTSRWADHNCSDSTSRVICTTDDYDRAERYAANKWMDLYPIGDAQYDVSSGPYFFELYLFLQNNPTPREICSFFESKVYRLEYGGSLSEEVNIIEIELNHAPPPKSNLPKQCAQIMNEAVHSYIYGWEYPEELEKILPLITKIEIDLEDQEQLNRLRNLKNIKEMIISDCSEGSIDWSPIKDLPLERVVFSAGDECIPREIFRPTLRELQLKYCDISSLPEEAKKSTNLEVLNIGYGSLSMSWIHAFPKLRNLTMSTKQLQDLRDTDIEKLNTIQLNLHIDKVPERLFELQSIEYLHFIGDIIPERLSTLSSVKKLHISDVEFVQNSIEWSHFPNVQKIIMDNCSLQTVPREFAKLSSLKEVFLPNNTLSEYPNHTEVFPNLETVQISSVDVDEIPTWIVDILKSDGIDALAFFTEVLYKFTEKSRTKLQRTYLHILIQKDFHKSDEFTFLDVLGDDWSRLVLNNTSFNNHDENFESIDLSHSCIQEADFSHMTLSEFSFVQAALQGSSFIHSHLDSSQFRGANLRGANLSKASLERADLRGTDLTDVNFEGMNVRGAMYNENTRWPEGFDYQNSGALYIGPKANLSGVDLCGVNLEGADLSDATFFFGLYDSDTKWPKGFDYKNSGAIGPESNLNDVDISGSNFQFADLSRANLRNANLRNTNLRNANLRNADLKGANLVEADLLYADLRYADLRYADLSGNHLRGLHEVILIGANLTSACLNKADLNKSNLSKANLERADLRGADLTDVNFEGMNVRGAMYSDDTCWPEGFDYQNSGAYYIGPNADLQGANFQNANLQEANLEEVNLQGADLWRANLQGANFQNANLREALFKGANLRVVNLDGANLEGVNLDYALYDDKTVWPEGFDYQNSGAYYIGPNADLQGADLQEANLEGADLQKANLKGSNLQKVDLQGADLQEADLQNANLRVANLHVANLKGADLQKANLRGAYLQCANLGGVNLKSALYDDETEWDFFYNYKHCGAYYIGPNANLRGVNLSGLDLREVNLRGADLSGANLREASLYGADFSEANLEGADLTDASYDSETTWPEGFDPEAAGAVLVED